MARYNAGNALSGAATGAAAGSFLGPIGTGVGAIAGGLTGLFGSKTKKPKKPKKISTLDPKQKGLYNDYIASLRGEGPFSDMYNYDPEGANQNFDMNVSRPAYRSFNENIVPSITGQFRGKNLMNSSYAGEALSRAGRDVQEGLDAQRSDMQFKGQQYSQSARQNALNNILNMQTFATQRPTERQPSTIDQILGKVAPAAGDWFADYLGTFKKNAGTAQPTMPTGAIGSQGNFNPNIIR